MSDTYYTDADLEMADLAAAGDMMANGVCHLCEVALNPLDPKWAKSYEGRNYTAQDEADTVGPHSGVVDGVHDACAREAWSL